jgi:hypothetical protein
MKKLIVFTEKEYNDLLRQFVIELSDFMEKDYGFKMISKETNEEIKDISTIGGNILIPWDKVFKEDK